MNRLTWAIAGAIGVHLVCGSALDATATRSQPRARPAKGHSPVGAQSRQKSIDALITAMEINSVRPGGDIYQVCRLDGFKALAWALRDNRNWLRLEKSEFETEAEFRQRTTKLENTINGLGEVVVCQPLDDNEDAPFTYKAEEQLFEGSFQSHQNVWLDTKRVGSYVSRTRMGARARVTSSIEIDYNLQLEGLPDRPRSACLGGNYGSFTYQAKVAREQAPLVKRTHFLAFAGKLVAPFVDTNDTSGSPTLDDPNDVYERDLTVHLQPTRVAVVGPQGAKPFECDLTATPTAPASAALATLFSDEDYPAVALRNHEEGTVEVRLDVGPAGRVSECTVIGSSGSAALDSATCRILTSRARLPAGIPVTTKIRWSIPR
jgi:TonB family protein